MPASQSRLELTATGGKATRVCEAGTNESVIVRQPRARVINRLLSKSSDFFKFATMMLKTSNRNEQ